MTASGASSGRVDALRNAAAAFDWRAVTAAARTYEAHVRGLPAPPDLVEVEQVLQVLREHLQWDEVMRVADAVLGHGQDDAVVRRHYAQALVDGGRPAAALLVFAGIEADPATPDGERTEARGGAGRSCKQLFVTTTDPGRRTDFLLRALDAYLGAYREDPRRFWHGINAVALLARAHRDGVAVPGMQDAGDAARGLAEQIRASVGSSSAGDAWARATTCEVLIALGRPYEAARAADDFARDPGTSAFAISSLLRQLLEIWQLDTEAVPGSVVLPVLRSALLARDGGGIAVETRDVRAARWRDGTGRHLEKVLGADRYQSLTWYLNGLARCRAVAQIQDPNAEGVGTGFLVDGGDLHPVLPGRVLVTNGHVVPEAIDPADAVVVFHGLAADPGRRTTFGVVRQWWYRQSRGAGLDTTVLELDGEPDDVLPVPLARRPPVLGGSRRAYLIGHPRGLAQPQFSLQDNLLLDQDGTLVHYRSPTEAGSSGSPVFDDRWMLIGLHHAGGTQMPRLNDHGGTYAANEAIAIPAIIAALRDDPPAARNVL